MKDKRLQEKKEDLVILHQAGGALLGYSLSSNIKIIWVDGYAFKDLNGNGVLDAYEDWRLPVEERISDLISQMNIQQMAGLMLYSRHQTVSVPDLKDAFSQRFSGTYNGKPFDPLTGDIARLTDQQISFLSIDNVRHVLMTTVESAEIAAQWSNNLQAFCESIGLGIPVLISSDPRHGAASNGEFFVGAKGQISQWPSQLGLAATFNPETVRQFGAVMAKEYRAMGIATALSPQIDLASDPRWNRYSGTFGEGIQLTIDLAKAYVDGCQTTESSEDGWGADSVNAMVKHWPGGGTGEGGRDAHFSYGKFAVYPGGNFAEHLRPFTEGAFKLNGKTSKASAVMPYYTISHNIDQKYGENVGNGFSQYIITDLLRDTYQYDDVVCTDWGVVDTCSSNHMISGMNWGVAQLSVAERHYKALMAGVDQFGGSNDLKPLMTAYAMGCAHVGEEKMRQRMETSARRLLRNIFRPGLFENPYLDTRNSQNTVGCAEHMQAGYLAQQQSVILLKNIHQTLPLARQTKVFIPDCPETYLSGMAALFADSLEIPAHPWLDTTLINQYVTWVNTAEEADVAIVIMESPKSMQPGYSQEHGYVPLTLQYRPYQAVNARASSLASGDPFWQDTPDRSYLGKHNTCANEKQLDVFLTTKKRMGSKPVIAVIDATGPMIMGEFEAEADAIIMGFELQKQVYLEAITGEFEPSGLLPFGIPESMAAVEIHQEDVPRDIPCLTDRCGHVYEFAFGMNFKEQIRDERLEKYRPELNIHMENR